jgi:hypothetical protein
MRKLAVAFLFGLNTLVAYAQVITVEKPVICSDPKTVVENVSRDYQEVPAWAGKDDKSRYVLTLNTKTGSWTIIQYNDKLACVLGTGDNGKIIVLGKPV